MDNSETTASPDNHRVTIPPALYERIEDAAYWEGNEVSEFVCRVMERYIRLREEERGYAYAISPERGRRGRPKKK